MPLFGGSPGGTSSENTSSYSYKTSKTAVGNVDGKSLVDKRLSLNTSTRNMALVSLKFFKSPFLAIITKPCFPIVLDFCGCGVLFGFGLYLTCFVGFTQVFLTLTVFF
jgi:hypothetical protein